MCTRIIVALALLCTLAYAQPGRRLALVIGLGAYGEQPGQLPHLPTAAQDAEAVADALTKFDEFHVTLLRDEDGDYTYLLQGIEKFVSEIKAGDVVFFYYAGHGAQVDGVNFILPLDFVVKSRDFEHHAIRIDDLIQQVAARSQSLKVFIIDACRDNPFNSKLNGLARMEAKPDQGGTVIVFSAGANQVAQDGVFAPHLVSALEEPGILLSAVFHEVQRSVKATTNNLQTPYFDDGQIGDFRLSPPKLTPELIRERQEADAAFTRGQYYAAMPIYQKLADAGDSTAMAVIGTMFEHGGEGVPKDIWQAFQWHLKAAKAGDSAAMQTIGLDYLVGDGVNKDPAKAADWLEKAANFGQPMAMGTIGVLYGYGRGVPKDLAKAEFWLKKAIASGDPLVQRTSEQQLQKLGLSR